MNRVVLYGIVEDVTADDGVGGQWPVVRCGMTTSSLVAVRRSSQLPVVFTAARPGEGLYVEGELAGVAVGYPVVSAWVYRVTPADRAGTLSNRNPVGGIDNNDNLNKNEGQGA